MARLSDEEIEERLSALDGCGLTENDFELARRIDGLAKTDATLGLVRR